MKNIESFSAEKIKSLLPEQNGFRFEIFQTVDSTNTVAKALAEKGAPENTVVLAETQTAGRGRMQRAFASPESTGIYMSIILRPDFSAEKALTVTTAAAVAVAEAVEAVSEVKASIKWVNDVYSNGKKICGILTEAATEAGSSKLRYAILGVGINVTEPREGFPHELKDIAGAVFPQGQAPTDAKNKLVAELLKRFNEIYVTLPNSGYMTEYKKRSFLIGEEVNILRCGEICGEGTVTDIDDECGLVIRYADGKEETLTSGEVSVKKKD